MTRFSSINLRLRVVLWAALLAGIALMSFGVRQVDLWWQLPEGLAILRTHQLPAAPAAAFGLPSQPFLDEYSLYEIVLAALYRIGGLGAIHAAFIAAYLLVFALPLAPAGRAPRDLVSCALAAVAAIFLINRFEQRPEIVGVLLLAALVSLLARTREFNRGFLLRLALLMAIWTNVHSSYLIGLLALALWLVQRTFLAQGAPARPAGPTLAFAVACAAVLVNPYGWNRVAFTFAQQHDLGSNLLSREMWPAWDQPADVQALILLTAALLLLVLASRQRPPPWLAALAVLLFLLTLFNIRHMSFLAAALLFLAANRRAVDPGPRWEPVLAPLLAGACILTFLFDFVAARSALSDLRDTAPHREHMFVPSLVQAAREAHAGAILCHDAEGSYVSFAAPGLHPLLDSGQGHFDDASKRLYFFAVQDPHAFDLALSQLSSVTAVLVTPPVGGWTLAMIHRPGWYLGAADEHGLLFRRFSGDPSGYGLPGALQIRDLATYRDRALAEGDVVRAFYLSASIDPLGPSLEILDRSRRTAWSEAFFSFARAWIRSQDPGALAAFVAGHGLPHNPLLRELLVARMPRDTPLPKIGSSGLELLARVLTLRERRDDDAARALLRSMACPKVSALYYALRARLFPDSARQESRAERWQDWTAGGEALFQQVTPQLNQRANDLVQNTGLR
jgi:hypothetical protein